MDRHDSSPASFTPGRRWAILLNVILSSAAVVALALMVNYLASRHYHRSSWSADGRHELSPMTRKMLETLTNQVKVIVFFDPDPQSSQYTSVKALVQEYKLACPLLDVEFVDYVGSPGRAALVKAQYKLAAAGDKDLVIFESNGRIKVVYEREMAEYDMSRAFQDGKMRRIAFKGEQLFTSAIVGVSESRQLKACFLQGHGEQNPETDDDLGYQKFARMLQENNVRVEPLTLQTNGIPADCDLLVIAGPRTPMTPAELNEIEAYLTRGGRAFILFLSPLAGARPSGLERLLLSWGVEVGENLVMDKSQARANDPKVLLVGRFGQHPIVQPLNGSQIALVLPRSIREITTARPAGTARAEELAFSSEAGVAARNFNTRTGEGAVETNGVIPLAVALEKGAVQGVSAERGSTRLVVTGDSVFLANGNIEFLANYDFASLAVNWLLDRSQLQQIPPRPIREYQIFLTQPQLFAIRWILLVGLPGSVLLLGFLVWLRRRR